jgi:hypothetical protein
MTVGISPPALMVAFVHEAERSYATAFRTSTVPSKTAFDCVSILDGDRGGLTTGAEPAGAAIPAARGSLRQVFPRATVEQVFEGHRQGLQHLRSRGLPPRPVSASTFRRDAMSRRQRRRSRRRPRGAAITRRGHRTPHIGPIALQAVAQATIRDLLTGARGCPFGEEKRIGALLPGGQRLDQLLPILRAHVRVQAQEESPQLRRSPSLPA